MSLPLSSYLSENLEHLHKLLIRIWTFSNSYCIHSIQFVLKLDRNDYCPSRHSSTQSIFVQLQYPDYTDPDLLLLYFSRPSQRSHYQFKQKTPYFGFLI